MTPLHQTARRLAGGFARATACAALLALPTLLSAQENSGRWRVADSWSRGIPGGGVRGITRSRDGYLLLATEGGLVRFDGVRFRVQNAQSDVRPDSIPDDYLHGVMEARDGTIWLAGWHMGVIQFANGRFRSWGKQKGLPDYEVNQVFEDSHGNIWAATQTGFARRAGDQFEVLPGAPRLNTISITEDATGAVWFGGESGLYRMVEGKAEPVPLPGMSNPRVPSMLRGRDGAVWVGTWQGLVRFERQRNGSYSPVRTYAIRDGLKSPYITCITEQVNGTIWVGTLGGGVARLASDGRFELFTTSEGLSDNNIQSIYADGEDNIWVGTVDGLSRLRQPMITNWHGDGLWTSAMVWSVKALDDGTVWVGTGASGAVRIRPDGSTRVFTTLDGLPSDVIFSFIKRRDGSFYVGTRRGIAQLVGERFVDRTAEMNLPAIGIRTMYEDPDGHFYIGTDSSLTVDRPGGRFTYRRAKGDFAGRAYSIARDRKGRLLVASGMLSVAEGDSLVHLTPVYGDTVTSALDLHPDSAGVWVGLGEGGLGLLRGDSLFRFPSARTGLTREVLNVLDDGRGSLWLTSGKGLVRVRKSELLAYVADPSHHIALRHFTKASGLRSEDFAKSGNSSAALDPSGNLWFPTTAGVVVVNPAQLLTESQVPTAYVERVLADGVVQPKAAVVKLPVGAHRVSFEFTTTAMAEPSRVRLWYKLEGVDTVWRAGDPMDRVAHYDAVPRGQFRFLVRVENADGLALSNPAFVDIISRPPLTSSIWFWILMAVIAGVAGSLFYNWRVRKLREHADTLQRLVNDRTEALATRERLEHQLLHAQKLESVGRLAGGVAHDLNNLLTAILGHAELALTEPNVPDNLRADLGEVRSVAVRAANLTRQLLTFARKHVVQPRALRLGDLVANVEKLVRRLLSEDIIYVFEALEGDWTIFADPNQVEQVVMNLAVNARDAMPRGGTLRMRTSAVTLGDTFVAAHPEFSPGEYVLLEVIDSGSGMPADVLAHMFEPFFTTKEPGKGTGLGLATSYGIVTQSGGHILVSSAVGEGTTFSLYFPRAAGSVTSELAVPAAMPKGTERLLVVEDESSVREVAERTLRALGYDVTTAADGEDALARLEQAPGRFALVLTDVRMPRLGGIELAARVRARWPQQRIVFMSGHSDALLAADSPTNRVPLLRKPFTASELAVMVRTALNAK